MPLSQQAQTEIVLYNFCPWPYSCTDGCSPQGNLTSDGAGNFYGTTTEGGQGGGTVFELSPNGSGGWNETVLYSPGQAGGGGGDLNSDVIFDSVGNLYGTTWGGGAYGNGYVFELSPVGGSWAETVVYSFTGGADGGWPVSGLILDPAGNLYGTTGWGGAEGSGTVFELSPSGGGWTEQVIYSMQLAGSTCGGVTMDAVGNLFGLGDGGVFELSPSGSGSWNSTTLHTFTGPPKDGWGGYCGPLVLDKAGNLYGTTVAGGAKDWGMVYRLSPIKKGKNKGQWKERILHSFKSGKGGKDGNTPVAGVVLDAAGNIYGTTSLGGRYGDGTVFELMAPVGAGVYKERILWSFNGTDGNQPQGSLLLDSAGNLYGTTYVGGIVNGRVDGAGVVFEVTP